MKINLTINDENKETLNNNEENRNKEKSTLEESFRECKDDKLRR